MQIALNRELDDSTNAIDHICIKLKKISETMNTVSAKAEASRRFRFIENYLELKNGNITQTFTKG